MLYHGVQSSESPTHSQGVYAFRAKWERLFLSKIDEIFLRPINAFFANISLYAISSYHQDRTANNTSIYIPLSPEHRHLQSPHPALLKINMQKVFQF